MRRTDTSVGPVHASVASGEDPVATDLGAEDTQDGVEAVNAGSPRQGEMVQQTSRVEEAAS